MNSNLVVYLLLVEGHEDHRDEEVEHHKRQEHDAGAEEETAEHRVVVQNLQNDQKTCKTRKKNFILT